MSEATPAAAQATPAAPAPSPAAAPAAQPTSAAPASAPASAAPAGIDWLPGADSETVGLIQNKGWKGAADAVQAYKHAASFIGAPPDQMLRLPGINADKATTDAFYSKLGRPADPNGYELALPQGQTDNTYVDWAKPVFHELGLTGAQAKGLTGKWNEFVATQTAAAAEARKTEWANQNAALQKEWGAAFEQNTNAVDKAIRGLGLGDKDLEAIRDAWGPLKAMKFFQGLGEKMGEDVFLTAEQKDAGFKSVMSPEQAQARITELRADKDWTKMYLNGSVKHKTELQQLMMWAHPDQE